MGSGPQRLTPFGSGGLGLVCSSRRRVLVGARRRALSLDHPVTSHNWVRIYDFSFFGALAYRLAYFLVIPALDSIDNPLPIRPPWRPSPPVWKRGSLRGQKSVRHRPLHAGRNHESRRTLVPSAAHANL
jgi:hypothetical protein